MNIFNYFLSLSEEINRINSVINEADNLKDKYNPFRQKKPVTYVWIENEHMK